MRFMLIVKASKDSEAGKLPSEQGLGVMAKFNEELVKAGVLLDAQGLKASSHGARISFGGGKVKVTDGPFTETKELIAGYWVIQTKSRDEAIEWAKRAPFGQIDNGEAEVEVRPFFELEDFGQSDAVEHHREVGKQIAKTGAVSGAQH